MVGRGRAADALAVDQEPDAQGCPLCDGGHAVGDLGEVLAVVLAGLPVAARPTPPRPPRRWRRGSRKDAPGTPMAQASVPQAAAACPASRESRTWWPWPARSPPIRARLRVPRRRGRVRHGRVARRASQRPADRHGRMAFLCTGQGAPSAPSCIAHPAYAEAFAAGVRGIRPPTARPGADRLGGGPRPHRVRAVRAVRGDGVALAAVNGPRSVVLSSAETRSWRVAEAFVCCRGQPNPRRQVSHAFHSLLMEPVVGGFWSVVAGLELRAPVVPVVSALAGRPN